MKYIEHNLVMLSNKDDSKFGLIYESGKLHYFSNGENPHDLLDNLAISQHLYITSNDEIKDNDWCLEKTGLGYLKPFQVKKEDLNVKEFIKRCKKIIATTDKSLNSRKWVGVIEGEDTYEEILLPQIPQQFKEYFITEYNKGNIITKVLVEYIKNKISEEIHCVCGESHPMRVLTDCGCVTCGSYKTNTIDIFSNDLIINPNNTINIKPIETKIYTREEVEEIIKKVAYYAHEHTEIIHYDDYTSEKQFSDDYYLPAWIEENL